MPRSNIKLGTIHTTLFILTLTLLYSKLTIASDLFKMPSTNTVIKDSAAQKLRNDALSFVTHLLSSKLPQDCGVISMKEVDEDGVGENYPGKSIILTLSLNKNVISFSIPTINYKDNPSSSIALENESYLVNNQFTRTVVLRRNYYTLEKFSIHTKFLAHALTITETAGLKSTDFLRFFYNAANEIQRIEFRKFDHISNLTFNYMSCGYPKK